MFGFYVFTRQLWEKTRKDAGLLNCSDERLKEFNWHSLRHHAASWMTMLTKDIYKEKEILGHRTVVTTQRYAHLSTDAIVDTVQALENLSKVDLRLTQEKVAEGDFRQPA